MSPVLALDIGGTKLAAGVVTADGRVHGCKVLPTRPEQGWQEVIRRLIALGRDTIAQAGADPPGAVGIACGGPLDAPSGMLLSPPNLPGWEKVPIGPMAAQAFGIPFALENDAAAGALAEHRFGAGRGAATMLYLTVSTGIGGGAIVDGKLLRGATGNGGEFGHVTVRRGGRPCGCGRRGCLEAYASGTAIARKAAHEWAANGVTAADVAVREAVVQERAQAGGAEAKAAAGRQGVTVRREVTAADVAAAAAAGDPVAGAVWAEAMDVLGGAVTDLVNVFEPDVVVIGGGVTRSGEMLLDPVRRVVAREAISPAAGAVPIVLAELGDLVGVVGAGIVAHDLSSRVNRDG